MSAFIPEASSSADAATGPNSPSAPHTPGPWRCEAPWSGFSAVRGGRGELVFGIAAGADHERQSPETCEANARLIAAAPELLRLLTDAADFLATLIGDEDQDGRTIIDDDDAMLAEIRAAIAKASGQPTQGEQR